MQPYIHSVQISRVENFHDWESASYKKEVESIDVLHSRIIGDEVSDRKNHGGPEKTVFANSLENYHLWSEFLGVDSLDNGALSENLTISGIDEKTVFLGDIHCMGEVKLQVVQPRKPCWKISKRYENKNFTKFIYDTGTTGWYYKVIQKGKIYKGDQIQISQTMGDKISIMEANLAFKEPKKYAKTLERILNIDDISENFKQGIEKRLQGTYSLEFMKLPI